MQETKTIMHLDMDAFFASVEQRDDASLIGKPVGVIGSNARTVLVTASYEARKFGVKTGMNIPEARSFCPEIILVKASHAKYTAICNELVTILDKFSPLVEIFSIDEFFIDATGLAKILGSPVVMAEKIKARIKEITGLTASIGIGPNKLIAKLASDISKPDGLKYIESGKIGETLRDLPVDKLCGIGKKTKEELARMNVKTCGELSRVKRSTLIDKFGAVGERIYRMGRGEDDSPVTSFREETKEKSMGHSMTLPRDIGDKGELLRHALRLSDMVGVRLRRQKMTGDTISLTVRYKNFATFSRQKKIDIPTNSTKVIFETASHILNGINLKEAVRLIGVSVHNLKEAFPVLSLFSDDERLRKLDKAKDAINDIFGSDTIQLASILGTKKLDKVISPSWRPHGGRRY